jgi:SnoaL-like domain
LPPQLEHPPSPAGQFVARFERFWSQPNPEDLRSILTDDVRLVQPLSPVTHGIEAACASFRTLFAQFPDLRATVDRWRGDDTCVFIEFRLHGSLGRWPIEWPAVDRFTLRGDRACERVSYFDSLPLALRMLRHPVAAWRIARR